MRIKGQKMRRINISLSVDELEAVKKLASKRSVSMSQVIRDAIKKEIESEQAIDESMLSIIGLCEGGDPKGSENHDDLIYK